MTSIQAHSILFIGDSISSLKLATDSSLALAEAALKNGYHVFWCEAQHINHLAFEVVVTQFYELISVNQKKVDSISINKVTALSQFKFAFVRKDPPFDESYKDLCWILASQSQTQIINPAESLLAFHEKSLHWRAHSEGVLLDKYMIPTCLTTNIDIINDFCCTLEQEQKNTHFICKPWLGHGGESVEFFETKELLLNYLKSHLSSSSPKNVIIQPFINNINIVGDRRVIIASGKIILSYVRLPANGCIASNGAQGGSAVLRDMTEEQQSICKSIASFLLKKNVLFAGLDLIDCQVGEINITSPTGIRVFEHLTGQNYSQNILNLLTQTKKE